jgi:hypothetical protein
MAKSKKNNKGAKKSSVKVQDMAPEQNPKGGALNTYLKIDTSLKLADGSVLPAVQLDPSKIYIK